VVCDICGLEEQYYSKAKAVNDGWTIRGRSKRCPEHALHNSTNKTVTLSNIYIDYLDNLLKIDLFHNRSDVVRTAIKYLLKEEENNYKTYDDIVTGFSLDEKCAIGIDKLLKSKRYKSASEIIRFAIRNFYFNYKRNKKLKGLTKLNRMEIENSGLK